MTAVAIEPSTTVTTNAMSGRAVRPDVGADPAHDDPVDPALADRLVALEAHDRAVIHHRRVEGTGLGVATGSLLE